MSDNSIRQNSLLTERWCYIDPERTQVSQEQSRELNLAIEQTNRDLGNSDIGVSISVVTPEGTWTGATGISNLETQQATQPDDLFNIGSVSKSYTSAVVLRLQEQGILNLDDTIDKWLPDIAEQITNGESLTIREILNGTGGIFDNFNSEEFFFDFAADYLSGSNRDWQPEELVGYAFDKPLFSGASSSEQWTYTNTGNVIAALIVEEATGKSFERVFSEEILEPLNLENTFFTSEDVNLDRRARGYADFFTADGNLGQDNILEDYSVVDTTIGYGAGSIVSSAEDVAIFFDSLASGELLTSESTAEIFNYVDTGFESSRIEVDRFGLGVYPLKLPWDETRSMDGSLFGYLSKVNYFPNHDTTVSILVNRGVLENSFKPLLFIEAYQAAIANTLGFSDNSAINGTETDDYLTGTSHNDIINGGEGNDIIIGKKSPDALDGGAGDDLLEGGKGKDYLFGKKGRDNLYGGKNDDFLNGGVGDDLLEGGKGSDFLIGSDGRDTIDGGKGDDLIDGGTGNDLIKDTQGNNAFYGNDGDDLLFAGKGDDVLYGDAGNDLLFGGMGDDELNGGVGDDNLIGGSGSDTLTGGMGSDRFVLSKEGTDTITDFTGSKDLIELPETISFANLTIIQGQGDNAINTLVNFESSVPLLEKEGLADDRLPRSKTLAVLNNIEATEISLSDFMV